MAYVNLQEMALQAYAHLQKNELKEAEAKLDYLLKVHPNEPILVYYLGCVYLARQQYGFAVVAMERALTLNPEFDQCMNNIATAYRQLGDVDKCIGYFKKAVEIAQRPGYAATFAADAADVPIGNLCDYLGNLGSCYIAQGRAKEALPIFEEALALPYGMKENIYWNQGLAYLELGDYEKGFVGYDRGQRVSSEKERSYHGSAGSTPWWPGPGTKKENFDKPTVVVYGEQGLGDEIMFASCIPDLMKDANVILECHPRLMDMFRAAWPEITIYGTRKATQVNWLKNHTIDYKIAIGSLAKFYRKKKEDFPAKPYLISDPKLIQKMRERLAILDNNGCRPKIGLSWKGGIGVTNKAPRCIPLDVLRPLMNFDVDFISLQYHVNAQQEVDMFNEQAGATLIHHWQDVVDDYDMTAGLLPCLNQVISVAQSVVHLAGALGVPTIQMCPVQGLWQMGPYGQNAPWYDSVQNFWQPTDGDWKSVIKNVAQSMEADGLECL